MEVPTPGVKVNFESLVRTLGRESILEVQSSDALATSVLESAKEQASRDDAFLHGKVLAPVRLPKPLTTSPAQVLHELGVATTFLTASPLAQVAKHWAHVRYCATLTNNRQYLALSRHAEDVVYHHKVTQSEQLGIGLALVVAKAVLRGLYPAWEFNAVDAEVALKAGFITGIGDVENTHGTKKRPDYFLVGHHTSGRRTGFKIVILECKGTHDSKKFAVQQLARASVQVEALRVGGQTPPSLMVASCLARSRITSYVLDPPGDGDLWSGPNRDMDDLLRDSPDDQAWRPQPAPTVHSTEDTQSTGATGETSPSPYRTAATPSEALEQPGMPDIFDIPEERRGWFTQVLTRAAAATALLFTGNSAAARDYTTPRQRGEEIFTKQLPLFDLDPPWALSTATSLRLPNGLRLEGTRYRTPLPDGKVLEVFRGMERRLYRLLADGNLGPYLRAAPRTYRKWSQASGLDDATFSFARDGTALLVRVTNERRRYT